MDHSESQGVIEQVELARLTVIVLLLVMLTLIYEGIKEYIEHRVPDDLVSIVDKLFGELTVLVFLSIMTFILSELKVFAAISVQLFGKDEAVESDSISSFLHCNIFLLVLISV